MSSLVIAFNAGVFVRLQTGGQIKNFVSSIYNAAVHAGKDAGSINPDEDFESLAFQEVNSAENSNISSAFFAVKTAADKKYSDMLSRMKVELNTTSVKGRKRNVAYFVLGLSGGPFPAWASPHDTIFTFVPPKTCEACPKGVNITPESGRYRGARSGWWCAQRLYLAGLMKFFDEFPSANWYFLSDADTVVFSSVVARAVKILDLNLGTNEDLYMGHARHLNVSHFVMSGGGVLIRGNTMRRIRPYLPLCGINQFGPWCYHHLDWVLGNCLRKINVNASGHPGFAQFDNWCNGHCCLDPPMYACHPFVNRQKMEKQIKKHQDFLVKDLSINWAKRCPDDQYRFDIPARSICAPHPRINGTPR